MKIEEALQTKKNELEDMQKDIDSLDDQASVLKDQVKKYNDLKSQSASLKKTKQASVLKDQVKKYNDLKSQSASLKKTKKKKQKELDAVIDFFQNVDNNYLTNIFPLFAGQGKEIAKEAATA